MLKTLTTQPSHSAIWGSISSWADAHVSDSPPAEPVGSSWSTYFNLADEIRRYIETMAFMFAMTDDTKYVDAAKDWMLSICAWGDWNSSPTAGWQVPCKVAMGVVFGYDVLYNYLTPSESETIRNTLIIRVGSVYEHDFARGEWFYIDSPNHIMGVAGTVGLTALAIIDDYPDAADWLNFAISSCQRTRLGQDGGYEGGALYAEYGHDFFVPFLDALKRRTGQNLFTSSLGQFLYYLIYFDYNGRPLLFEDRDWYSWNSFYLPFVYRLAAEFNNSYGQWFADTYADQSYIQSYIWKDPNLVPTPPTDLPLTRHFRDYGYVIFRTGWGANDLLFAFKSGHSMAHAHPSQNEFHIYYQGKPITCGPGYVLYEPENNSWSHNCLLVDSKGQGVEEYTLPIGTRGIIQQVDVNDPYYRYVRGDGSPVYTGEGGTGELDKWLRHVVFIENPNYFVIYDDVAADTAKQFDWLLQGPKANSSKGTFVVNGDLITLTKNGRKLRVIVVEPEGFAYEIVTTSAFTNYIKVCPPIAEPSAKFLTVLSPNTSVLPIEKVKVGNALGVMVEDGKDLSLILFSSDSSPVDQWIDLGGYYRPVDGQSYEFNGTRVRAQFDTYQVMRLKVGVAEQTVELAPGERKVVSFVAVPHQVGTYHVTVDGLHGTFRVVG